MILSSKTLQCLRDMINERTEYRSGPKLVQFFNEVGFNDSYGQGFPSRWMYTDERLSTINGTPELDKCIKQLFSPINFIGRIQELDNLINDLNQYLAFDKWRIVRNGADISFKHLDRVEVEEPTASNQEDTFLNREFSNIPIHGLGLEGPVVAVLEHRVKEIEKCFSASSPLAVILLAGSSLEGVLLGLAIQYPRHFNTTKAAPKDSAGKVKQFHDWSLSNFIDMAKELTILKHDTYKFSHSEGVRIFV